MNDVPQFTPSAERMARWYFRIGGALVAAAGVLVLVYSEADHAIGGWIMLIAGSASLAFSFVRRGDRIAHAAREYSDIGPD